LDWWIRGWEDIPPAPWNRGRRIRMLIGYPTESKNHVIDMSFLAPFKDKKCELIIFRPSETSESMILPFKRWIRTDSEIEQYNLMMAKGEIQDKVKGGSYGRMETDRHIIHTPIENGPVWVIVESDDLLR